jgi:hypothetical protein
MRTIRSYLVAVASVIAVAAWPAFVAAQGQPGARPVAAEGLFFEGPGLCAFDVRVTFVGKAGVIALPNGGSIATAPGLFVTVTNLSDPSKSVTLNSTGTFHQFKDAAGNSVTIVRGRNVLFDPFAGFVVAIGTFSFAFDPDGNLVQPLAGTGQTIDICALIQ